MLVPTSTLATSEPRSVTAITPPTMRPIRRAACMSGTAYSAEAATEASVAACVQAHVHRPALERVVAGDLVDRRDLVEPGVSTSHVPSWKRGQRGWKLQADGGLTGLGTSPSSITGRRSRPFFGSGIGTAGEQSARVRVLRVRVQLVTARKLGGLTEVHHHHAIRDVTHDVEVVSDEDVREPELLLQVLEQVQNLRLHRDVERRYRLVAEDELGVDGERAGDADRWRCPPENS